MFRPLFAVALASGFWASTGFAQDDSDTGLDDASSELAQTLELDDADRDAAKDVDGAQLVSLGKGPLAYGTVHSNGAKVKGSSNWSSNYNSTYKRYEITISDNSYYYLNYATVVTPAGDARFCRSSSVSGKLLVYCYDHTGQTRPSRFGFLSFKP